MRFFTGLLLFSGLFLAGCRNEGEPSYAVTASYLPYVSIGGVSKKVAAGSGVELGLGGFSIITDDEFSWGFRGSLAWSRHNETLSRPEADYFRLGAAGTFAGYWTGKESTSARLGFDVDIGLALHYLAVDGPGDVAGIGPSGSAALRLRLGRQAYLAAGVDLDFWLSTEGDVAGTFAPFARFGVRF